VNVIRLQKCELDFIKGIPGMDLAATSKQPKLKLAACPKGGEQCAEG